MAIVRAGRGPLLMDSLDLSVDGSVSGSSTNVRVTFDADDYIDFGGTYSPGPGGSFSGTVASVTSISAGNTDFTVTGANADAQTLFGLLYNDNVIGAEAYVLRDNDRILGRARGDHLYGFAGNDVIAGGAGDDRLVGGAGADRLYGDAGADTFVYQSTGDSTVAGAGRDRIYEFSARDGDRIDLSAIDAITGNDVANDSFTFTDRFHNIAGELVVRAVASGGFLVLGDTDGINGADFSIFVDTTIKPVATDFQL